MADDDQAALRRGRSRQDSLVPLHSAKAPIILDGFHGGEDFPAAAFGGVLSKWLEPLHWQCSPPFLAEWYNRARDDTAAGVSRMDVPETTVAYALYSVPGYLDVVTEHFAREKPQKNYVDSATDEILGWLREKLQPDLDALVVNTDEGPPYYHVQTVGAVAGVDQHMEAEDLQEAGDDEWREDLSDQLVESRDPKMWGSDMVTRKKIFGVNIHPKWGGWYAYRALVILRGASTRTLCKPDPLVFLPSSQARRILAEYNLSHDHCHWRDLTEDGHPPHHRYDPDEYFFFTEVKQEKRKRFLEMRAARFTSPPKPRVSLHGTPPNRLGCCRRKAKDD